MDTITQRKYTKNDHSELCVLLTKLNTVPRGARRANRETPAHRDAWHDVREPDDDIRGYDDPDDNAVDENTANLTANELELMKPSLISAIEMLRRYDYSMFPDIKDLHRTDRALARSMASVRREKYQRALAALSTHDYDAARRHLRYIIQYLPRPADNTVRRNLAYMPRPAARRTH